MAWVKFANVGDIGLMLDPAEVDVPAIPAGAGQPVFAWTGGNNVRFNAGYAEKFLGHSSPHGAPSVAPYGIFFTNTTAYGLYEVYAGLQKIYAVANTTHTDITRALGNYTGAATDKWTGCTLSDILILNNGVDDPQYWAGNTGTPFAALTNWPANTKCKVMRSFDGALVALNITESGTNYKSMVRVSASADPGTLPATWVPAATNDAVRVEGKMSETPDAIVDGLELGERFMVYKENSTYAMHLIGGTDVYAFENVSRMFGALAVNCVAPVARNGASAHAVFSDGDIVLNQGAEGPQSIIDEVNRRWLFNNLDSDNRQKSFAVSYQYRNEVWFCFPEIGHTWPNKAMVWNYKDNTWSIREIPNLAHANTGVINVTSVDTWNSRTDVWNDAYQTWGADEYSKTTKRLMMASTDTGLYLADAGISFAGSPMTAYIEHSGMDFEEIGLGQNRVKLCKGVRMVVDAPAGTVIRVYVGTQDDMESSIDWGTPQDFTVGTSKYVDFLTGGTFLGIKFESVAQGPWRIKEFSLDIEDLGESF